MASMGERFIFCRFGEIDPVQQASLALRHVGRETVMRGELRDAVRRLFEGFSPGPFAIDREIHGKLSALASLVARCRSSVERDAYRREVELIPDSELPARIAISLARLLHGMTMLGVSTAERWRLISKVALDCVPDLRRKIVFRLIRESGPAPTKAVALAVRYPTNTTRRSLEDLAAHGMVTRFDKGKGRADEWVLSSFSNDLALSSAVRYIADAATLQEGLPKT